jgi:uncharacterized membrane protein
VKHRGRLGVHRCPTCDRERDRGAVIPVVALTLVTLIAMAAMTIDLGRLMIKRRDLQALADVVSLDLVRDIDGSTYNAYLPGGPKNSVLSQHRDQSVTRNGGDPTKVTYQLGIQNGKGQPFVAVSNGNDIPNAIKVTATDSIQYFFARIIGQSTGTTSRSAVASQLGLLDYEAGSFLASTVQAGLLNGLIGGALGGPINLSAVSYQGLAAANVPLGPLATQLGFGSPDQLLGASVGQKNLYLAAAQVLSSPGGCSATPAQCTAAVTAFNTLAASASGTTTVNMPGIGSVVQGGPSAAANADINALGLVTGSAFLVNGTNTISVPGVNVNIPGVGNVNVTAKVTQGIVQKWGAIPNDPTSRSTIQTSQIDITIATTLNIPLAGGLLNALSGNLTVRTQIAGATVMPTAVNCSAPKSATVSVTPQPVTITGSEDLTAVSVLGIPALRIQIPANTPLASLTGTTGSHGYAYPTDFLPTVGSGTDVTVGSSTLGLPTLMQGTTANASLLGIPLGPLGTLLTIANAGLQPVLTNIDSLIVSQVAQVLGIYLGGAAVGAIDLHCNAPQLVG